MLQAMAEVHLLRRDQAAALELYDELLRQNPRSPKLWNERGVCLHQDGRRDEAAERYGARSLPTRTTRSPGTTSASSGHGASGAEAAMTAFRSALERQPRPPWARLNLALLLMQRRAAPAGARGVPRGAAREQPTCRRRGTASGSCWWSSSGTRMRATRSGARCSATRTSRRRTTT